MWRMRVIWTGSGVVGPTVSTFYALDTSPGFPAAVRALMAAVGPLIPTGTSIQVPNNGDVINPADGTLTGSWSDGTTPAVVACSGTGTYSKGVGAQIRWRTTGIVNGRRVQGSTFIVPLVGVNFAADGNLASANLNTIQTAATNYVTAAPYACIWSRPAKASTSTTHPHPARVGTTALIAGASVPNRPSWLLTRRT